MTEREIEIVRWLERGMSEVYDILVKYKDISELNGLAGVVEAYQFTLAQLRGYKGD